MSEEQSIRTRKRDRAPNEGRGAFSSKSRKRGYLEEEGGGPLTQ